MRYNLEGNQCTNCSPQDGMGTNFWGDPCVTWCCLPLDLAKFITTLTLGSRPRQGVARLRAKRKTRESHHMFSGVQRVWRNEPSHSQVNSNVGSWNPKWTPESSQHNCKGQNALPWKVIYIIGKLLKRKCLKWACITHLDIWNISHGQKKGRKSIWQFDSWPLKVRNQLDFLECRRCATYHWKALNKG
jgi:hypothetical protein